MLGRVFDGLQRPLDAYAAAHLAAPTGTIASRPGFAAG
jgi:hypothetical protein